jgi:hypothetical protein
MPPAAEAVTERLENTWLKWWTFSLLTGIVLAGAVSLGVFVLFVSADALLQLSSLTLLVLCLVWVTLTLALVAALIVRARRGQRTLAATARRLEMEYPELGSNLINLVQLAEADGQAASDFYHAAISQAASAVEHYRFDQAATKENRWHRLGLCMQTPRDLVESSLVLSLIVAIAFGLYSFVPRWPSSTARLLHPWKFVPSEGVVKIVNVKPGDTVALLGSSLEIVAEIDNAGHKSYPARLYFSKENEAETTLAMMPDESNQRYVAGLPQALSPMRYRVEIGDSQSRRYTVGIEQKPTVTEVEVTYSYPAYLERPKESCKQKHADLEAPQYTVAELCIETSTPIANGHVMIEGQRVPGYVMPDGQHFQVFLFLRQNTTYTIHLFSESGHTDAEPRVNQIRVIPDMPPTVQIVEPARESTAAPGSKNAVIVRAADDHGLGLVRIEMKRGETGTPETLMSWTKFANSTAAVLQQALTLDPAKYQPGQVVLVRAVAQDRRYLDDNRHGPSLQLRPQESVTPWHQLRLIARETQSATDLAQLDLLRTNLWKILQTQLKARIDIAEVLRQKALADGVRIAGDVKAQQIDVQKATSALVESLGKVNDEERLGIKRAASKLATGYMLEAVRQAETLATVKSVDGFAKPAATLQTSQDRIIDVLRRMLNELRRETADKLVEMEKRAGGDLPNDVKDKLRELKDKLQEFLKQQKKVIEATENLAKMPVEDFTEKEEQLLKKLAATEDNWSRFLKDVQSDLSKLPEQDFANPSLLAELVEVQTELKMAEDALTKKTADIAVPLEQLGAEMAKEMTTNIEKWLPDTPDRERWSQEEPLTEDMKEAPMAELMGELEDIIGDLMEQEEDLFDEMEDVTSSWADSIDKGAGWDAMDGPISNNSARGVTGNRLPNTSEIAGRSGEGRQGKASGEFVGDTAVGKGGRKTPSRLTPDANVKGQVKDQSKDPVGGATGGGKESGQGGEGLEGPVPKQRERQLERLAGKQAELRNKAESIDLQFKVQSYHHTDVKKLAEMMATVEQDLRAGRYQNALRRRDVLLDKMEQVKTYLHGEFTIRQDQTPNLPTDIQKEILGNMQEASPAGWDKLNRQYFERLSTTPGARPKQAKPDSAPGKAAGK